MATNQLVRPAELKNSDKLGKDHLNALIDYLGRLEEVDDRLAAHAVRYVIDGSNEDVLQQLAGNKEAAGALRLVGAPGTWQQANEAVKERGQLWRPGREVPPDLCVRLAQVFNAARRGAGAADLVHPGWPTWFATLAAEIVGTWFADGRPWPELPTWPLGELEGILASGGLPPDFLARALLDRHAHNTLHRCGNTWYGNALSAYSDWTSYLVRHLSTVREALARPEAEHRLHALGTLAQMGFDFAPLVDLLVQFGTGPAKSVRDAVLPLLERCRDQARPLVDQVLAEGDAGRRHEAALLLWRLHGRDAMEPLRQHLTAEPSERVRQTIAKLLAAPDERSEDVLSQLVAAFPPVRVELGVVRLPEEARAGLRTFADRAWEQALRHHERLLEQWNSSKRPVWMKQEPQKPGRVPDSVLENLAHFAETGKQKPEKVDTILRAHAYKVGHLGDCLAHASVKLIHVVRLANAFDFLRIDERDNKRTLWWHYTQDLEAHRARCPEPYGLRELDAAVESLPEAEPGLVATAYLAQNRRWNTFCDWEPQAIWPIFAERPEILQGLLGPAPDRNTRYATGDYWWSEKRRNAFRVLALFPQLPSGFIPVLWDLALGESKADRPLAQAALATVPDKVPRIRIALGDGRQAARAAAAEWLGKIGDPSAIEPLKDAFRREKQEPVKGALLVALEALGADIGEFLDRDALLAEAEAGLAKKQPKGMEWLPLESLPSLHWADTGRPVASRVVQRWVVQSVAQKSAGCGPLLRRYLELCRPDEAAALARFVLAAWIAHDTAVPSPAEAAALARKEADRRWAQYGTNSYWINYYQGDKENLYRQLYAQFSTEFKGSAIGQKGMLALVSAAGDADCVQQCDQYIRKWFGNRLAQCKALLEVLAWVKQPLAVQVLLGLANRFRTRALRQTAEEYVQALAEREGWTIDELADRTIPDAGFARPVDDRGVLAGAAMLVLDYGPRQFTVTLNDALEQVVTTADGKAVKTLPEPGKQDDRDKAKAARKAFADAKKTVKAVVKQQTERLYEALCTQRTWRFGDWHRYLAGHSLVSKLCARLAWAAFAPEDTNGAGRFLGCFRPLEDGSLTNEQDEAVTFPEETTIRLAHTCNTPGELAAAWVQHFADYEVKPLFPQFGRAVYVLPADREKATEIADFEGYGLTTFQLRGKATKLGYLRGEAEDGGCFYIYRKPFPSLGVQAVLAFTGSTLPEQDMPAALETLYFATLKGDREAASSWQPAKLPLSRVPPVLLSECYNDIKQIAAEGSGYDPGWRERSYF
jgi:HEAT repeat protein